MEEAQCRVIQLLEGACPLLKDTVLSEVKAEERLMEQQKAAENGYKYAGYLYDAVMLCC